ncbi:PDZ/DHR/GLGF domain protein [Ostertagia ostertagi]
MDDERSPLEAAETMFAKMPTASAVAAAAATTVAPSPKVGTRPPDASTPRERTSSERNNSQDGANHSMTERFEMVSRGDSTDGDLPGMRFVVTLVKDPSSGLGLTLVDGNLNGVKGVYVKSVAENGAGMRAGLCVGDRLLGVDGASLEGGDRHRAVELVRQAGDTVSMEIARLDGGFVTRKIFWAETEPRSFSQRSSDNTVKKSGAIGGTAGVITVTPPKGVSRTPPAPRRAANRRQRAVSDFGAIGDTLPALDSDNVINIKAISGLHLDESDEEQGEYRLPTTSMYSFEHHYDDESPTSPTAKVFSTIMLHSIIR